MFKLKFRPVRIHALAEQYGPGNDDAALAAGRRISKGDRSRANFETIVNWKTQRVKSRVRKNTDEEIADALNLAVLAKTERSAIAVLVGLEGVAVPVASAILTTIDPERYTVIDYRALHALGNESADRSVDFYLRYLDACRALAKKHNVTLRDLDRALWQWSSMQSAA